MLLLRPAIESFVSNLYSLPMEVCDCLKLGEAAQTFRIRKPKKLFEVIATLSPDRANFMDAREVWACRSCGQLFAMMRIPEKDLIEYLVRGLSDDWTTWNWKVLADLTTLSRWRGQAFEDQYLL